MVIVGGSSEPFDLVLRGFARSNTLGAKVGFGALFAPVTVQQPRQVHPELDFIRLVSWLYANWHEAGRVSLSILLQAVDAFSPDSSEVVTEHRGIVAAHRTLLHHDLGVGTDRAARTQNRCEAWFSEACGVKFPDDETGWVRAYNHLCAEAALSLDILENTVQALSRDVSAGDWVAQWHRAQGRELDDGHLDRRIARLAGLMGIDPIRPPEFRRRHRARWVDQIKVCQEAAIDLTLERAITNDLLAFGQRQHPLTPEQVIRSLDLPGGPLVGEAMRLARRLFDDRPGPASELLVRLKAEWEKRGQSES